MGVDGLIGVCGLGLLVGMSIGVWFMIWYVAYGGFGPRMSFETEIQRATEATPASKIQQKYHFPTLPFQHLFLATFTTKKVVSPYETHHRAIYAKMQCLQL